MSRFGRYLVVGLLNTVWCLMLILFARAALHLPDVLASLLGYAVGVAVSFIFNRRWTFQWQGRGAAGLPRFLAALGAAWLCNMAVVWALLHAGLAPAWAHAAGVPVYTAVSFVLCARFVFRSSALGQVSVGTPPQPGARCAQSPAETDKAG